jgi:hypothetical protein
MSGALFSSGHLCFSTINNRVLIHFRDPLRGTTEQSMGTVAELVQLIVHIILAFVLTFALFEAKFALSLFGFLAHWTGIGLTMSYLAVNSLSLLVTDATLSDGFQLAAQIISWVTFCFGFAWLIGGICGGRARKERDDFLQEHPEAFEHA